MVSLEFEVAKGESGGPDRRGVGLLSVAIRVLQKEGGDSVKPSLHRSPS